MPLIFQHRIYRQDLQANEHVLYVFGDNLARQGYGGQAGECRDEPNAVGLPTKRRPSMSNSAFFTNADLDEVRRATVHDVLRLKNHINNNEVVVWPLEGIGTGLAQLPERAKLIMQYYDSVLAELQKLSER